MKPSKPTMDQIDAARRTGPWDREIGWKPTEEMQARADRSKPFWTGWDQELLESIQQIHDALIMRCRAAKGTAAFNPDKSVGRPSDDFTPQEREVYDRFLFWLEEMRDARLNAHVTWICGFVLDESACKDREVFKRAVGFHAALRRTSRAQRSA